MANDKSVVDSIIERYRHIPVNELRETLRLVPQLRSLDLNEVPDPIVRVFHGTVVLGNHEDAPEWFFQFCEWIINGQRDGELKHQDRRESDRAIIRSLKAQLGEDVVDSFFANAI